MYADGDDGADNSAIEVTPQVVKREPEPICPRDNDRPLCCSNMISSTGDTGGLAGVSCDTRKSFEPLSGVMWLLLTTSAQRT